VLIREHVRQDEAHRASYEADANFVIAGHQAGGRTRTDDAPRSAAVGAVGADMPVAPRPGGIFDGGLAAALSLEPAACGSAPLYRDARGACGHRLQGKRSTAAHETHSDQPRHGQTLRAIRNDWTQYVEEHRKATSLRADGRAVEAARLPRRRQLGAWTRREYYPWSRAWYVGDLVPAGDLVRRIVAKPGTRSRSPRPS
jgi:hypothetical protein